MKATRKRLEIEISRIDARCEQLRKHVLEYKEDYEDLSPSTSHTYIKYRQLKMVSQSLKEILYYSFFI